MDSKFNAKAILVGFLADIVGTVVASFLFAVVVGIIIKSLEIKSDNEIIHNITMVYSMLIACFFSGVGGYVAGKVAKRDEILNALSARLAGIIFSVFLVYKYPSLISSYPKWYSFLSFVLVLPAAYLGGVLARKKNDDSIINESTGSD